MMPVRHLSVAFAAAAALWVSIGSSGVAAAAQDRRVEVPHARTIDTTPAQGDRERLLYHLVFIRLRDEVDAQAMIDDSDQMIPAIPGVQHYWRGRHVDIGRPNIERDYTVAIGVTFASEEAYRAYLSHPLHEELVERWSERWLGATIYDVGDPGSPGIEWMPLEASIDLLAKGMEEWTVVPNPPEGRHGWTFSDGVLRTTNALNGYIRTNASFERYELSLEWRYDPAHGPGNSGVLLAITGADRVWPDCVEAQLQSGNAGDIINLSPAAIDVDAARTTGRRTTRRSPSNERAIGEWNHYRIVVDGGNLELWVNGVLQNTARDIPARSGPIGLQSEGAPIEFRRIHLRERRRG